MMSISCHSETGNNYLKAVTVIECNVLSHLQYGLTCFVHKTDPGLFVLLIDVQIKMLTRQMSGNGNVFVFCFVYYVGQSQVMYILCLRFPFTKLPCKIV